MADKVTLGFEVTGIQQAKSEVDSLYDSLKSVWSGLNTVQGAAPSSKPSGSPANTPSTTNGLGEYNSPINSQGSGASGLGGLGGSLLATLNTPQPSSNIVPSAPQPNNTGGNYGQSSAASGGSGNSAGSGTINVNIVGSIPIAMSGGGGASGGGNGGAFGGGAPPPGGSGGGSGGGGGASPYNSGGAGAGAGAAGGGASGGGGGASGGGGGASNPYTSGTSGFGAGGGVSGFIGRVASSGGGIGGLASTAVSAVAEVSPMLAAAAGPVGLAFAALKAISAPADDLYSIYAASAQPMYNKDTSLIARSIGGQFVSDTEKRDLTSIANTQGAMNSYKALNSSSTGRFLNFIGLGIPDLIENYNIQPRFERELAEKNAKLSQDLQINRLSGLAGQPVGRLRDGNLELSTGLAGSAANFGTAAVASLVNSNMGSYTNDKFSAAAVQAGMGTVYSAAGQLGQNNMFGALSSGGNPAAQAYNAANVAISSGDLGALASLQPLLGDDYGRLYSAAVSSRANLSSQQIGQAKLSGLQSGTSLLGATGAGYQAIAESQRGVAAGYDPLRKSLEYQARLETNDIKKEQLNSQIIGLNASQAAQLQSAAMTVFTGRGVDNQALSIGASNTMYTATYGKGTQAAVDSAYAADRIAKNAEAQRFQDMSESKYISPEQRRVYRETARQGRLQASIGIDRDKSQYDFSMTQGRIGVDNAKAGAALSRAQLFGNSSDIYKGDMGMANVTGERLSAVTARLADPKANLSAQERIGLETEQINLTKEFNNAITQASRSFASMNLSVAQTTQSIVSMRGNMQMQYDHVGGAGASSIVGANVTAAADTLSAAQAKLDNLKKQGVDPKSQIYKSAEAELVQAQAGQLGAAMSYSSVGPSLQNMNAMTDARFALSMMDRTPVAWGNKRAAYEAVMTTDGKMINDNKQLEQDAIANLKTKYSGKELSDHIEATQYDFKVKNNALKSDAADAFSQYSSGWMDRLISQQIGGTSRSAFTASQFSMREAAPFIAAAGGADYNGYFGFGGEGAEKSRNNVQGLYSRLSGPNIGGITTAADFLGTALSGAKPGSTGPVVLRPGGAPNAMPTGAAGVGVTGVGVTGAGKAGVGGAAGVGGSSGVGETSTMRFPGTHERGGSVAAGETSTMRFPGANERGGRTAGIGETSTMRFPGPNERGSLGAAGEASMLRLAAGINPGGVGGTLKSPEIRIIVEDHRIIVKSGGKTATATLSKGGNAPVIAALGAGAASMLGSSHAAAASHQ